MSVTFTEVLGTQDVNTDDEKDDDCDVDGQMVDLILVISWHP